MARYIDADELYKATQKRIAEANEARMAVVDDEFLDLINDAFTEDVAPRAEVDELIYKLECLLCHATGGKLSKYTYDLKTMETVVTDYINESYSEGVEDGYKDGAAEVAMEIFAEIYSYLTPYPNRCALISLDALAELKKKYTGAETEPPEGD